MKQHLVVAAIASLALASAADAKPAHTWFTLNYAQANCERAIAPQQADSGDLN